MKIIPCRICGTVEMRAKGPVGKEIVEISCDCVTISGKGSLLAWWDQIMDEDDDHGV